MKRTPLPSRRRNETFTLDWRGQTVSVTFGIDAAGRVREVFADIAKTGTDLQALLADWCVIVSVALQHDIPPSALARSLCRVPDPARGEGADLPASLIGAIMEVATTAEFPEFPAHSTEVKNAFS